MFHHCMGWTRRHAYAHGNSQSKTQSSFYESRQHGRSSLGVRRPLRYLAYHLDLSEDQMRRVAILLDRLKTEREQARLDESKTVTSIAELIEKSDLSMDDLAKALDPRIAATQRLTMLTARTVFEIRDLLDEKQRQDFAYLISNRTIVL